MDLFNFEYFYNCKQSEIWKPVPFIAVKCFIEGLALKFMMYIVSCLNT